MAEADFSLRMHIGGRPVPEAAVRAMAEHALGGNEFTLRYLRSIAVRRGVEDAWRAERAADNLIQRLRKRGWIGMNHNPVWKATRAGRSAAEWRLGRQPPPAERGAWYVTDHEGVRWCVSRHAQGRYAERVGDQQLIEHLSACERVSKAARSRLLANVSEEHRRELDSGRPKFLLRSWLGPQTAHNRRAVILVTRHAGDLLLLVTCWVVRYPPPGQKQCPLFEAQVSSSAAITDRERSRSNGD